MKKVRKISRSRRAAEWRALVTAWKRSGQTAAVFAKSRGIKPDTLRWWSWNLGVQRSSPVSVSPSAEPIRLVPLCVEANDSGRDADPLRGFAWEVRTAQGHRLRVHESMDPAALQVLLAALIRRGSDE